jgi:hypothetical protein
LADRKADRHKPGRRHPIPFRPPRGDEQWLKDYAAHIGQPVNAILTEALRAFREMRESSDAK